MASFSDHSLIVKGKLNILNVDMMCLSEPPKIIRAFQTRNEKVTETSYAYAIAMHELEKCASQPQDQ